MGELPAPAGLLLGAGLVANPGHPVTGALKAPVALGVDVQEISGARPLVANHPFPSWPGRPGDPVADQGAVNGRVRMAGDAGDQPRAPASVAADLTDPLLLGSREHAGAVVWAAGAIPQPLSRAEAVPPLVGCRRCDGEGPGGASHRRSRGDRLTELVAGRRSELGPRVNVHPGSP